VVETLFRTYDYNKNGTLELKEVQKFLNDAYTHAGKKPCSASETNTLFKQYDANKDGVFDRKEFKEFLRKKLYYL
jgi:Ca2+-binding EF-hand superfamily protein